MNWNSKKIISFDIETTSLSSPDGQFVCSVFYNKRNDKDIFTVHENTIGLKQDLQIQDKENILLITYNGENYRGGFDFPWLRTHFNKMGFGWPFKNIPHLDLYPLIKKYFNFDYEEIKPYSKSKLSAPKVKELANTNDIEYSNKRDTYKRLNDLEEVDWLDYQDEIIKSHNDLQTVYQELFDSNCEEEYIDGAKTAELVEKGEIEEVIKHCKNDVVRLYKVTDTVLDFIPTYEVNRNIKAL